jgi:D-alanyl-D-alanine carboxypeptidase
MKWIIEHKPEIINITLLKSKEIKIHTWTNPTHLLNLSAYIGGKNGYTVEANRTSISLFSLGRDKKQIIAVIVLGSSRRDSDVLDLLEEAIR